MRPGKALAWRCRQVRRKGHTPSFFAIGCDVYQLNGHDNPNSFAGIEPHQKDRVLFKKDVARRSAPARAMAVAALLASLAASFGLARPVRAQTDEIQVYDATIEGEGQVGLDLHNNFTPIGRTTAEFPGGVVPDHAWNGVPEFAYGVTDWFEAGLYLPVYTLTGEGRAELDSTNLRALFVSPGAAQRTFFYGINFELSYNAAHWEPTRLSGEIRPIAGLHLGDWDVIVNPIVDTDFRGVGKLDFAPAERIAYNFLPT